MFFHSNWIAPATRPALLSFREQWINDGGPNTGLDINRCTAYGGLCEHPEQLKYCISAGTSLEKSPKFKSYISTVALFLAAMKYMNI